MKTYKSGAQAAPMDIESELELVNAYAKTELKKEQVYIFSVILCDNEVDRDFEKFSDGALEELRELFIGKTGIFDHEWRAENQTARIYRTEICKDAHRYNSIGEPLCSLKGFAYMLRSEKNEELIQEIEAGIKKETSVERRVCSICAQELHHGGCGHIPGREYGGKLCYYELFDARDAYEWSFVAVPAQRGAGVVKSFSEYGCLKELVQGSKETGFSREYEALEKDAALGREYRDSLRNEVMRLGLLCDKKLYEALEHSAKHMEAEELLNIKKAFEVRLSEKFPVRTQLPGRNELAVFDGGDYIV